MTKIVTITFLFYFLFSGSTPAQDVVWKKNFGSHGNNYESIITVSDGVVVVGRGLGFNFGDWEGVTGKGGSDAIIVKYNNNGNVIWKKNFGGEAYDTFFSVTEVPDGIVAVGYSSFFSFNTGDWEGIANKGGDNAIIVKYNHNGNVVWKKNFGGRGTTQFLSVATVPDGIVAVGYSTEYSFNNGDWEGITGNGDWDAIIVKYDLDGNVVWKKNFGGKKEDYFNSVASSSDGIIAVGNSDGNSFGNGDWVNINGKGVMDCILVKYDFNGNVVWKKNFGGVGIQGFYAVATTADGIVAAGGAYSHSFETGDWE
ncbi:MAG: hypothetical protein FWC41_06625, partial [Firmicutes bacterium]|nr:hypothetical protein [Bacillota bacterium]